MKILSIFNKIKNVFVTEKNFMIFLLLTLINSILIEGGTVFSTIPWLVLAVFLLKLKYKDSKLIVFHVFFSLVVVGIVSGKIDYAAAMCISSAISVYAGLMLHTVTKYLYDKNKSTIKKILKVTVCLVLIMLALMINSAQYGSFGSYLKASNGLKKYIKEEYDFVYKGNVYYNFSNRLYYIEVYHKDNFGLSGTIYYNASAINENEAIYDWYKKGVKDQYEGDIIDALTVAINTDDKLENISKEDIKVSLNIGEIDYKLNDIFSYEDSINVNIELKSKYENIVEFNNYVFSLVNRMNELNLNYNEIIITSLINDVDKSYYKIQIANGKFPDTLKDIEEISYIYTQTEGLE